jgi:hypothetical protein
LIDAELSWAGESSKTGAKESNQTVPNQTLDLPLTVAYIIDSHGKTNKDGNQEPWANYMSRTHNCLTKRRDAIFNKLVKKFLPTENQLPENTKKATKTPVSIPSSPKTNIQEKSKSTESCPITTEGPSSPECTSKNGENSDIQAVGRTSLINNSGDRTVEFDDCLGNYIAEHDNDDDDSDSDFDKYTVTNKEDKYTVAFSTVMKFLNHAIPEGKHALSAR